MSPGFKSLEDDLVSGELDAKENERDLLVMLAAWIAALVVLGWILAGLAGCMTVQIDHVVLTDHSNITVSQPKTVTTTTDASIPAGALGL